MDFIAILRYIGALSVLIPLTLGVINYRNLITELKVILYLLVFVGVFDLMLFFSVYIISNNELITKIFTLVEYGFIAIFYILALQDYFNIKKLLVIGSVIFGILFINSFVLKNSNPLDSFSRSLESIVIIITSLIYAFKTSISTNSTNSIINTTSERSLAIINIIFLIYFSLIFFIFLFGNILIKHPILFYNIWIVNALLSIITNLLFAYSLWTVQIQTK